MGIVNIRIEFDEKAKSIRILSDTESGGFLPFSNPPITLDSPEECTRCELLERLSEDEQLVIAYFWMDVGKISFEE